MEPSSPSGQRGWRCPTASCSGGSLWHWVPLGGHGACRLPCVGVSHGAVRIQSSPQLFAWRPFRYPCWTPQCDRSTFSKVCARCSTSCKAEAVQVQYVLQGQASCMQQAENEQSCTPQALSKVCCAVRLAKQSKLYALYIVRCICCTA